MRLVVRGQVNLFVNAKMLIRVGYGIQMEHFKLTGSPKCKNVNLRCLEVPDKANDDVVIHRISGKILLRISVSALLCSSQA